MSTVKSKKPTRKTKLKDVNVPDQRTVLYPHIKALLYLEGAGPDYLGGLTAADAVTSMGWEVEPDDTDWSEGTYLLRDGDNRKCRAVNNANNRPFDDNNCERLIQEHLTGSWEPNGETIVIGEYGTVLDGQHSYASLILAQQRLDSGKKLAWKDTWPDGVIKMQKIVIVGVKETDKVINTMNTGKPRSFTDVVFRSDIFGKEKESERKLLARMTEFALDLLWYRTGRSTTYGDSIRTHSMGMKFITDHPKVIDAVRAVHKINHDTKGGVGKYLSPGYSSALLYMMGTSATDEDAVANYHAKQREGTASEKMLDFSNWSKAVDYWAGVGAESAKPFDFRPMFQVQRPDLENPGQFLGFIMHNGEGRGSPRERMAVLCNAWLHFADDRNLTQVRVVPDYFVRDSVQHLDVAKLRDVGGIDIGSKKPTTVEPIVTPAQLAADVKKIRAEKDAKKLDKPKEDKPKAPKGRPAGETPSVLSQKLLDLRDKYPDDLLVFSAADGGVHVYGGDALIVGKAIGYKVTKHGDGVHRLKLDEDEAVLALDKLVEGGRSLKVCMEEDGETVAQDYEHSKGWVKADAESEPEPEPEMTEEETDESGRYDEEGGEAE